MTFYSDSNVSTKYLDPKIFTPNARCTFELDQSESAYLPNLRLTFIGAVSDAEVAYNDLVGALALIKNIRLMDGKTVLCSMNEAQFYTGFKNVNNLMKLIKVLRVTKIVVGLALLLMVLQMLLSVWLHNSKQTPQLEQLIVPHLT